MTFKELNLHPQLLQAIDELGYATPTPIQKEAIPQVLAGKDLCASAHTGTGKTAAFLLPSLTKLFQAEPEDKNSSKIGPKILILVPTRELAMQVSNEAIKFTKYLNKVKTVCVYGGVPYPIQKRELSRPYEILVATPGRLIDHLNAGRINLSKVNIFILDEADRMLDMGFIEPVTEISEALPEKHQTLLFSATLKESVIDLVKDLQNNPVKIKIAMEQKNIEQRLHMAKGLDHKHRLLSHILSDESITQAIIFTSTKSYADELKMRLIEDGFNACALHGDIPQNRRTQTINKFRQGRVRFLIATDVAARGIDIPDVSHIINFDLPRTLEDYVHRIGRTGRIGAKGLALSFATAKDKKVLSQIERFIGHRMTTLELPEMKERPERSERKFKDNDRNDNDRNERFEKRDNFKKRKRFHDDDEFENARPESDFSNEKASIEIDEFTEVTEENNSFNDRDHKKPRFGKKFDDASFERKDRKPRSFGRKFNKDFGFENRSERKFGSGFKKFSKEPSFGNRGDRKSRPDKRFADDSFDRNDRQPRPEFKKFGNDSSSFDRDDRKPRSFGRKFAEGSSFGDRSERKSRSGFNKFGRGSSFGNRGDRKFGSDKKYGKDDRKTRPGNNKFFKPAYDKEETSIIE
ncbi:MAG: DEAD/DEAH box helicase [Parachlamydiales bacterium]|jgi:superfamily II DNA/RNA helicase